MSAISRFGSQPTFPSPRSTDVNDLKEMIKEIIEREMDVALEKLIIKKNIVIAKPQVVDFGGKRLTNLKPALNTNDAVTLGHLPFTKMDKTRSLHFGSYRLLTTGDPSTPQDFITLAYADKHYEAKKKKGG